MFFVADAALYLVNNSESASSQLWKLYEWKILLVLEMSMFTIFSLQVQDFCKHKTLYGQEGIPGGLVGRAKGQDAKGPSTLRREKTGQDETD